ncbi:MAG: ABC transporter permease [Verrucomicrobiota bacterium]
MPWNLYLALKQLLPTGKRFGSFFFLMSVLGVALGVMVLIVVQSVMGGFGQMHRERAIEITGHLDISQRGRPFLVDEAVAQRLQRDDRVATWGAYANGFVLAQLNSAWVGTMAFGVDPEQPEAYGLTRFLTDGTTEALDDDAVIISRSLLWQLGAQVGDELEVFTPIMIEGLQNEELILPRSLRIVGIYNVEWDPDFIPGLVVTLRTMRDFYDLGPGVHGLTVRLEEGVDEHAVAAEYSADLPLGLRASTWQERWAQLLSVLEMEKVMMLFLNLFIVAVAVFAIAVAQLLNVVRKTREIGVLQAFGGQPRALWGLFCFQGLLIGLLGTVLGMAGGVLLLTFRGPIIDLIVEFTGSRDMLTTFYFFTELPVHYTTGDFVLIGVAAVVLATLSGLLPAWRATRLRPAEALRMEN